MPFEMRLWDVVDRGPDEVLDELVVLPFVLSMTLLEVLATPEAMLLVLAPGLSLGWFDGGSV